ncbi:MAG: hypothetical protein ACK4VY_00110 [Brevundimonas sp.]
MAKEADLEEVLEAVGDVLDLIARHDGEGPLTARIRRSCSMLAADDLDGLRSLLSETTGGMGSLNDYGFMSDVEDTIRHRKNTLTSEAADKCRIALRSRGIEPWR